jgi:hypothetical protein
MFSDGIKYSHRYAVRQTKKPMLRVRSQHGPKRKECNMDISMVDEKNKKNQPKTKVLTQDWLKERGLV